MKFVPIVFLLLSCGLLSAAEPIEKHPEWDQTYSKKIREYTTETYFLTDLVDHLPASDKVPTTEKILGYVAGQPGKLTYAEDVHRYMRALESASPRIKVLEIGKTEEGRSMILVVIADEKTIQNLDRYKQITSRLSDPRKISDEEALHMISDGKPMYYATGAMHSPETGSPEMLMELAYRLVVEETPQIQSIRNNIITLITPVLEVDGRNRMVDLARWQQANPEAGVPPLVYWGHYVAHDNNRDFMGLSLALTQNVLKAYYEWHPQVIHDLHESIPFLYISTGTGPYNAWLDPLAIDEWHRMAYHEVQTLTAKGLPGVWTHGFYDGWAPGYMFWVGHGHNSIGRFYETFGNGIPTTQDRVIRDSSEREWFRPNPPLPKVKWSLRNNINYQQSGLLLALQYMAENPRHFLNTFWLLGKRAIAKATTEGPTAYVFPGDQKRQANLRDLLRLLNLHGIEVHQMDAAFAGKNLWPPKKEKDEKEDSKKTKADEKEKKKETEEQYNVKLPAGSFVVRMDQPYSRLADALLDTQFVLGSERVYDDAGWTLGYVKNVEFKRIVNPDFLKTSMHLWTEQQRHSIDIKTQVVAIENTGEPDLARLRYALSDSKVFVTEEESGGKNKLPAGTLLVQADSSNSKTISDLLSSTPYKYKVLDTMPSVRNHPVPLPRIAILHTWLDAQDEGWYRLAFDTLKVPYDYISTQDISRDAGLRSKYDVILFPPVDATPQEIVNGLPPGPPIPWKKTDLTPNLGVDETSDMRPGLGLSGVQNLKTFVEEGGLLITCRDTAQWAVEYGLARWVKIVPPQKLRARGSILRANVVDQLSPIVYGYDDTIPVHFSGSPIFKVGIFSEDDQEKENRPSGRGSKTDPDVPQGRPFVELPEKPKPGPGEEGFQLPENGQHYWKPYIPKIEDRPRVILRFPKESDQILLSGMLEGADEIANKPVLIDSPLGKGHILLFANNPMWRMNTQGNYPLIFNAIFYYQSLNAGWPPPPGKKEAAKK